MNTTTKFLSSLSDNHNAKCVCILATVMLSMLNVSAKEQATTPVMQNIAQEIATSFSFDDDDLNNIYDKAAQTNEGLKPVTMPVMEKIAEEIKVSSSSSVVDLNDLLDKDGSLRSGQADTEDLEKFYTYAKAIQTSSSTELPPLEKNESIEAPKILYNVDDSKFPTGKYVMAKIAGKKACGEIKWSAGEHIGVKMCGKSFRKNEIQKMDFDLRKLAVGDCGMPTRNSNITGKTRVAIINNKKFFTFEDSNYDNIAFDDAEWDNELLEELKTLTWKRGYFKGDGQYRILKKNPRWRPQGRKVYDTRKEVLSTKQRGKGHTRSLSYVNSKPRRAPVKRRKQSKYSECRAIGINNINFYGNDGYRSLVSDKHH